MLCPHCGAENPTPFGYCSSCTKPLSTVHSSTPPPPGPGAFVSAGAAPGRAPEPVAAKTMNLFVMLAMFVVIGLVVFLGFTLPTGETNQTRADGFRIGRTFAALFFPFLLAYVIAGRKSTRNPNRFAAIFCGLALLFMGGNVISSGSFDLGFESPDQHVGRLMREAAGLQP